MTQRLEQATKITIKLPTNIQEVHDIQESR